MAWLIYALEIVFLISSIESVCGSEGRVCGHGYQSCRGRSGGAKVLGKLPVPGRPTNLDYSRARAYCACSKCRWVCLDIFFSHLSLFSLPLSGRRPNID